MCNLKKFRTLTLTGRYNNLYILQAYPVVCEDKNSNVLWKSWSKNKSSDRMFDHSSVCNRTKLEVHLYLQIVARAKYNIIQCVKLEQILQKLSPPTSLALKFLLLFISIRSRWNLKYQYRDPYKINLTN